MAIRPSIIGCTGHGIKILAAFIRFDFSADQLAVRQVNAHVMHMFCHFRQKIITDLIAQPAAAGMQDQRNLALKKPKGSGRLFIKNFFYNPHFQKVVAGAQSPQLILPPFQGRGH